MSANDYYNNQGKQYYPPQGQTLLLEIVASVEIFLKCVHIVVRSSSWSGWILPSSMFIKPINSQYFLPLYAFPLPSNLSKHIMVEALLRDIPNKVVTNLNLLHKPFMCMSTN